MPQHFSHTIMEESQAITYKIESDGTCYISFKQAAATGNQFLATLRDVLQVVYDKEAIRGAIFVGTEGPYFLPPFDTAAMRHLTQLKGRKFAEEGQEVLSLVENCHKPIIAAIHDKAWDVGYELALACHLRVGTTQASLRFSTAEVGQVPGFGGTQRLPQLVGKGRALDLLLTARTVGAREAKDIGLLNVIVQDQEQLLQRSHTLLQQIVHQSPLAIGMLINCVNATYQSEVDGYQVEANSFAHACPHEEPNSALPAQE